MIGRTVVVLVTLGVGIIAALIYAASVMGATSGDLRQIAFILAASGAGSLLLSIAVMRWGGERLASLRLRFALAYGVGLLVALVNVVAASALMFLSQHDLAFLILLIGFSALISLAFGFTVGTGLVSQLGALARSAGHLAAGDLTARVHAQGSDEVGRLAAAFDHMANQLQTSFERQRELELSRRELIAAVSHDLRTPLATIRAMVESIKDGVVEEPAEVRRYLDLTLGEVHHLSRLIDDLFELSQIESGALELRLAPTRIPELLAETLEAYLAAARDSGVEMRQHAEPEIPIVNADPARLQRVLRNLIDNALQFTPSGGSVSVEARRRGTSVLVSVSDTGPGIADEDLGRIFERFYRGERARSRGDVRRRSPGAGLGLAIAQALVLAHGGSIWADSSGQGAAFHFTVPLAAA